MLIRIWFQRERLGHETDFRVWPHAVFEIGIEDMVQDGPVIDRLALRVLAVSAGGAPLERWCAIARGQQVVSAEIDPFRREGAEFGEQLLAILHRGVIRLIRAEEPPDGAQLAFCLSGIDADGDGNSVSYRRVRG